ncbi:Histidine-specific methyltransferase SAM-dependent domain-containing protein [Bordetella tumbae]
MFQSSSMLAGTPSDYLAPLYHAPPQAIEALQAGLLARPAHIDPKYLYDALGSSLFTAITQLPEYYPTRCEAEILRDHATDIAQHAGKVSALIDLGAGDCVKAEKLFPSLRPEMYIPIDISVEYLHSAVQRLKNTYRDLNVSPIGEDFHHELTLPDTIPRSGRLFFYPGSSIGNLDPERALALLIRIRQSCDDGGLLIGVDRVKSRHVLEPAYDDALHLTAAFNLNLLRHVNQRLGSDFDVRHWQHVAHYDEDHARVQMHLQAQTDVDIHWPQAHRTFRKGERIHTENSYKYTPEGFRDLLTRAGFSHVEHWSDACGWFSVFSARA